jgi:hypothetical protein
VFREALNRTGESPFDVLNLSFSISACGSDCVSSLFNVRTQHRAVCCFAAWSRLSVGGKNLFSLSGALTVLLCTLLLYLAKWIKTVDPATFISNSQVECFDKTIVYLHFHLSISALYHLVPGLMPWQRTVRILITQMFLPEHKKTKNYRKKSCFYPVGACDSKVECRRLKQASGCQSYQRSGHL